MQTITHSTSFIFVLLFDLRRWLICEECRIETLAWGYDDDAHGTGDIGYVIVNGIRQLNTTWGETTRGFNTVELVLSNCSTTNIRRFDTWGSSGDSDALALYVNSLPSKTILIGVTADSAEEKLTEKAKQALMGIGVDVSQLKFRDKLAFVAQVGIPSAAVMHKAQLGGSSVKLNVVVSRT